MRSYEFEDHTRGSEVTNKGLRACVRASEGAFQCLLDLNIHKLLQEHAWARPNTLKIDFLMIILKNTSFPQICHGILWHSRGCTSELYRNYSGTVPIRFRFLSGRGEDGRLVGGV